jgi:cytochrome c oxidase subunit 2
MTAKLAFGLLVVLGLVWTALWLWVVAGATHEESYPPIYARVARLRRQGLYILGAVGFIAFVVSLRFLPYAPVRALAFGQPELRVNVTGLQWYWKLSANRVPAGVPVEFRVTADDVNHGFGLYDPSGRLVAQVQAMPGYVNRLIYTFWKPGNYTIRCLELCGVAHHLMTSVLTVTPGRKSDGSRD